MSAAFEHRADVTDLRQQADRKVAAKRQARDLDYELAQDLPDEPSPDDDLIEGVIGRHAMSVLYGDSNSGKTFLAIDIGAAVGLGGKWMERNVEAGMVVYLATEAPRSVRERLKAYHLHHGAKVPNFVIVKSSVNLFDGDADTAAVISLIKKLELEYGAKCELVIGDTLARLSAGANENSGEDMGVVVGHVDRIRQEVCAHFMLIHHSGKDAARGMRGWSGLRAAADTEIEVTADESTGSRAAEITKQRDMGGKGERIGFRLVGIEMGVGKWGKPRTSCVVVSAEAPERLGKAKRMGEVEGAVVEFLAQGRVGIKKSDVVRHFEGRYEKGPVYRAMKSLVTAGAIHEAAGMVCVAGAAR